MKQLPADLSALLEAVDAAAVSKHAHERVALDVRNLSSVTDVIYVCHGDSTRAVQAIADAIVDGLDVIPGCRFHVEGLAARQWVLIDTGTVMAHVFLRERRSYYDLERLWHDARPVDLPSA